MMRAASPRSEHRQVRRGQQNWRKGSQPGGSPSLPTALSPCCCRPPATPLTSPSLPMQGWGCLPRWSGCSQQQWWRTAARTLLVHPGLEHLGDNWHHAKLEPAQLQVFQQSAQFAHQIIPEFCLDWFKDNLHVQEPRTQTVGRHVDHLDNSQVFTRF